MRTQVDVSFIVTNYNTGPFLTGCVEALFSQDLGGRSSEVIVVDNASFLDQGPYLAAVRAAGATVLRLEQNQGHGGGCNRGLAASVGKVVFFVNSDLVVLPGAVAAMLDFLQATPQAGLVEPRTFLDEGLAFFIPENAPPNPMEFWWTTMGRVSGRVSEWLGRRRIPRWTEGWRVTEPTPQQNLTGAFLGARREVIDRFRGYDERYPLFYEDTDLFARMSQAGLVHYLIPAAEAIHYSHRSVHMIWEEAVAKSRIGRARFLETHHGRWARRVDALCDQFVAGVLRRRAPRPRRASVDLGPLERAATLRLAPGDGPFVIQLAFDPFFLVAAGCFGEGDQFTFSDSTWASLFPTTYHVRALDTATLRERGRWTFSWQAPPDPPTAAQLGVTDRPDRRAEADLDHARCNR